MTTLPGHIHRLGASRLAPILAAAVVAGSTGGCEKGRLEPGTPFPLIEAGEVAVGFDLGLGGGSGTRVEIERDRMVIHHEGAAGVESRVFLFPAGPASSPTRSLLDLSTFRTLSIEMRSASLRGGVLVGMIDRGEAVVGGQTRLDAGDVDSHWRTKQFDLDAFLSADLTQIRSPLEIVIRGDSAGSLEIRDAWLLP